MFINADNLYRHQLQAHRDPRRSRIYRPAHTITQHANISAVLVARLAQLLDFVGMAPGFSGKALNHCGQAAIEFVAVSRLDLVLPAVLTRRVHSTGYSSKGRNNRSDNP